MKGWKGSWSDSRVALQTSKSDSRRKEGKIIIDIVDNKETKVDGIKIAKRERGERQRERDRQTDRDRQR